MEKRVDGVKGRLCLFWAKWSPQGLGHIILAQLLHHLGVGVKHDHGSRTPEWGRLQDGPEAVIPREKPHTGAAAREQPRDSPVIER